MIKLDMIVLLALIGVWGYVIDSNIVLSYKSVDPILEPYVFDYYQLFKEQCPVKFKETTSSYTIDFIPDNKTYVGVCMLRLHGFRLHVNREWWDNEASLLDKRQLIYHELSHCVLDKDHVNDIHNYMYPIIYPVPYDVYVSQVKSDMKAFCNQ